MLGFTGASLSPLLIMVVPGAAQYCQLAVSLLVRKYKSKTCFSFSVVSRCLLAALCRLASAWTLALTQSSRNVPNEWVFDFQGIGDHKKNFFLYLPLRMRGFITAKTYLFRKTFSFLRIFIFLL